MKPTNEMVSQWINEYIDTYGGEVLKRAWDKRYVYGHAPFNNAEDCYHVWLDLIDKVKEALRTLPTFELIYEAVKAMKIKGIGPLTIYDTATMLAFPDKKYPAAVYLHAGAKKGAEAIGITGRMAEKSQFVALYPSFEQLSPAEIEKFLCVYRDKLMGEPGNKSRRGC